MEEIIVRRWGHQVLGGSKVHDIPVKTVGCSLELIGGEWFSQRTGSESFGEGGHLFFNIDVPINVIFKEQGGFNSVIDNVFKGIHM